MPTTVLTHLAPNDPAVVAAIRAAEAEDDRCRAMTGTATHAISLALVGA